MIVGDLPSYEAFPIGGTNSVRGYNEGERACVPPWILSHTHWLQQLSLTRDAGGVGSGRNYVVGTMEAHIPLVAPLEATFFADWGSGNHAARRTPAGCGAQNGLDALPLCCCADLDSGASVRGDPAGARGKPGSGWGVGAGIRIDTPIGPLR